MLNISVQVLFLYSSVLNIIHFYIVQPLVLKELNVTLQKNNSDIFCHNYIY